jgi:tryptophan-rich sensory protein
MAEPTPTPVVRFLLAMTLVYAVAFVGAQGSMLGLAVWYETLQRPSWTPPNWLFGPVWTILYAGLGVGLYRVWQSDSPVKRSALIVFGAQLVLNGLWSWLFFAWQKVGVAAIEMAILVVLIGMTLALFRKVDRIAAWLLVPYLGWVCYATALNIAIWSLNR